MKPIKKHQQITNKYHKNSSRKPRPSHAYTKYRFHFNPRRTAEVINLENYIYPTSQLQCNCNPIKICRKFVKLKFNLLSRTAAMPFNLVIGTKRTNIRSIESKISVTFHRSRGTIECELLLKWNILSSEG